MRLNKTLQGFRDNLDGVELTPEQHQELQRSMDTKFHAEDRMNDLVTSSGYKNATDYEKEQMIDSLWRSIRDQARSSMYSNKEFRDAYKKNLKETLEQQDKELPNWLKNLRDDNNNKENRGTYQMGSWADKILEGE